MPNLSPPPLTGNGLLDRWLAKLFEFVRSPWIPPSLSGNAGKYLTNNGTIESWGDPLIRTQISQSANYTTVLADADRSILHPSSDASARTFTIAANGSVPYAVGTVLEFINQNGAGVVSIAINTA
jgi:hypothetical protein